MKVTLLISRLSKMGGLEKTTLRLAKSFAKHGCETTILTTGMEVKEPGIHIHTFGPAKKLSYKQLLSFDEACLTWLKRSPAEIVFGLERNSMGTHYRAGSGVHAAYLQRRKIVDSSFKQFTFAFNPLHRTLLSLEKKCFQNPEMKTIFTNSNMVKEELLAHYQTPLKKIAVVHNGGPLEEWKEGFEKTFSRKRCTPFHFLFVGSGFRRKGLHLLLQALPLLTYKDFCLSVVGDDKELHDFQRLAAKYHLENKVAFYGPQKQLIPFYQAADALVIPSTYDPFAGVTMEGLAMGLFVVTSRYNGGHEVITQENGCVIENLEDPQSIANALTEALAHLKTKDSAQRIRNSIQGLDFSTQCDKIVHKTLGFND